jgi:hypothetical protein
LLDERPVMEKNEAKKRFTVFLKAGLPFTIAGMAVVFGGLWAIKTIFKGSEYLTVLLFVWLGLFWFIYQPMFRRRIEKVKKEMSHI